MDSVLTPGDSARLAILHDNAMSLQDALTQAAAGRAANDPARLKDLRAATWDAHKAFHEALKALTWPQPYNVETRAARRPR